MFCVKKPIILVELLRESSLELLSFKISEDGTSTAKNALGKDWIATECPRHWRVERHPTRRRTSSALGQQQIPTEVTPKASSTCENEAEGAQRRPSTKRALLSDQYSELDDEITSLISRQKPKEVVFSLISRLSRHNSCSLLSLIPGKNSRARSRSEVVAFHDHIEIKI